ncbi:MAG TPA: hypothetical protein VGI99_05680 [Gemmataceae bacterium]|jgi:hypothetical protein
MAKYKDGRGMKEGIDVKPNPKPKNALLRAAQRLRPAAEAARALTVRQTSRVAGTPPRQTARANGAKWL